LHIDEFTELIKYHGNYETEEAAKTAVEAFTKALTVVFSKQESISLKGFGEFGVSVREGSGGKRVGSNEIYNRPIQIIPNFKATKILRDKIIDGQ